MRFARPWRTALLAAGIAFPHAARAQDCPLVLTNAAQEPALADETADAKPGEAVVRIDKIEFVGNGALSDEALARRMRTKAHRFWRRAHRSVFTEERWRADHRRLCDAYRDRGHVTAAVGPPELLPLAEEEGQRRVTLRIPVREGPRYRLGELTLEGTSIVPADEAREQFDLEPGETYRHGEVRLGLQRMGQAYGRRGYAAWSSVVTLAPRPSGPVVGVAIRIEEGLPRFVGRIEFRGHRGTLDATLRREVPLSEGDLLDTERLQEAVPRIDALGYVRVKDVKLEPSTRSPVALDVSFLVEELPKLRYGLAGGVSGLEGLSFSAAVGVVNALGRGERAIVSGQLGEDVRSLDLALSRPYPFGSPWTVGLELNAERLQLDGSVDAGLPAHVRTETALRLVGRRRLGRRALIDVTYALSDVDLEAESGPPPAGFGRRSESSLAFSALRDGWDHPWKPRAGVRTQGRLWLAGGPLGGANDAAEARGRVFALAPVGRKAALAVGVEAGVLGALKEAAGLPFDQRYLLGGETQIRGFESRTVGPRDAAGTLVGGTRFLVLQAEAHLDVGGGLRGLAFVDAGQAWAEGRSPSVRSLRLSTGVEVRFALPVLRLPVRVMLAGNPARDPLHPRRRLAIAVGPVF